MCHSKLLVCELQGELTRERFPKLEKRINNVLEQGMFSIADLAWIAPCLETTIRVTMMDSTHEQIIKQGMEIEKDSIFGPGEVAVHLLFSWVTNGSGRLVGHFDLLQPSMRTLFATMLPPDATWPTNIVFVAYACGCISNGCFWANGG